jgi:hypothetical protein
MEQNTIVSLHYRPLLFPFDASDRFDNFLAHATFDDWLANIDENFLDNSK